MERPIRSTLSRKGLPRENKRSAASTLPARHSGQAQRKLEFGRFLAAGKGRRLRLTPESLCRARLCFRSFFLPILWRCIRFERNEKLFRNPGNLLNCR